MFEKPPSRAISADFSRTLSEYAQDWFFQYNFFRHEEDPSQRGYKLSGKKFVYADLGGCLPFDYSNTVFFDRCKKWSGVCVEPNPSLVVFLEAYRKCRVLPLCVSDKDNPRSVFRYRDGDAAFAARCTTLSSLLTETDLHTVDFLSVDVENQEEKVFQNFNFADFDVRFVVVEVGRGVNWLKLDTLFLKAGYLKIAILSRDVVYASLKALKETKGNLPGWEMLNNMEGPLLPPGWDDFHYQVINDETKTEEYMQVVLTRSPTTRRRPRNICICITRNSVFTKGIYFWTVGSF